MTTRTDYSAEEWESLESLPFLIGAAVISVSRSGAGGKIKEAISIATGPLSLAKQFPNNALIDALLSSHNEKNAEKEKNSDAETLEQEGIVNFVFQKCREGVTLLEQKSTSQETEEYKTWLMLSAEHVAKAARSGGFLGFGGKLIDVSEEQFLQNLEEILGIKRNQPETSTENMQ